MLSDLVWDSAVHPLRHLDTLVRFWRKKTVVKSTWRLIAWLFVKSVSVAQCIYEFLVQMNILKSLLLHLCIVYLHLSPLCFCNYALPSPTLVVCLGFFGNVFDISALHLSLIQLFFEVPSLLLTPVHLLALFAKLVKILRVHVSNWLVMLLFLFGLLLNFSLDPFAVGDVAFSLLPKPGLSFLGLEI